MSTANPKDAYDLSDILAEEARMLRARSFASARMVLCVIAAAAVMIALTGQIQDAMIWIVSTSGMVGVTLIYARHIWAAGIADDRVNSYLHGHVIVTGLTGALWGGFAIYFSDPTGEIRTFVAGLLLSSITTGGALSGTVYRPGYLALIICSLVPFGIYLVALGEGVIHFFGYFMLMYFVLCYVTNERLSRRTREDIVSRLGREAAQKIIEQGDEIERLYAQKTRFMANISHDMIQPLLAQRHLVQSLMGRLDDPDQIAILHQIENTQASQERLVQELAELSQIETNVAQPQVTQINLEDMFEQLASEVTLQAQDQGMQIQCAVEVPTVTADYFFLERILRNLLSNAVKYAGHGAQITLGSRSAKHGIIIEITDTGVGMKAQDTQRVFDEYVRLDAALAVSGSGLGLTISRRLARQLGGDLTLHSGVGQGTTAKLELPQMGEKQGAQPRFVVLIGGDTSSEFGPWANLFSAWMWEFALADDAQAALDLIASLRLEPDVFLFDATPEKNGALEKICQIAPCLLLAETDIEGMDNVAVLKPPFTVGQLRTTLERLTK